MNRPTQSRRPKVLLDRDLQNPRFDAGTLFEVLGDDPYDAKMKVQSLDPGDSTAILCRRDVLKELTPLEALVLLPVKPVRNRLKIYRDDDWLKEIPVICENKRVIVKDKVEGIVKFKGVVKEYGPGIRFIVEIQDGTNDPIKRKQCVSIQDLRLLDGREIYHGPNSVAPRLPSKKKVLPGVTRSDPPQHERLGLCELALEVPLRVNDRVVWVSDHGPEYGTVRWLGHLHDTSQDLMVGVEFDNRVGTGTGKYRDRQLFEAQLGHASLIPLLGLLKADDYLGEQTSWGAPFPGQVDYGNSSFYLSRHEGRPRVALPPNHLQVRCPQLCGPTDPFEREHLQRHDSQASNASQKKKLVYPRTNDSGKDASCSDSVQKRCELKERSCSPQEPQTWLPLGHSANCLQDLVGRERGIQGHHNSCYLDATLFAMFSCTDVFDSMIHRPKRVSDIDEYSDIQKVLRDDIVNELRRKKFVSHEKVMKLRELLDAQGGVSGLTTEEKDPEEFLNSLFRALGVEPYLKLSSGQGTHLYQLFVEKHELLDEPNIPTVQQLFHHSIHDSNIKLNEIPSALIIQMPRFGKQFKVYPRIIPSLTLDITDALKDSPRSCFVCGRLACKECRDCFRPDVGLEGTSYCSTCSEAVHKHPDRVQHTLSNLKVVEGIGKDSPVQRHYMDLCAVVCIETSHYVCFVKCGQDPDSTWVFFDSMADREGAEDGHNIPEVVVFHDHALWLGNTTPSTLQTALDSKNLGNMSRRLVCDAYMCMYKSNMAAKYS
ncbi:uncharacterized protein ISCGN_000324 [Ixodes scapularis]